MRELRDANNKLLCKANDSTGMVETQGDHKSICSFILLVGQSVNFTKFGRLSRITRTESMFVVEDLGLAA